MFSPVLSQRRNASEANTLVELHCLCRECKRICQNAVLLHISDKDEWDVLERIASLSIGILNGCKLFIKKVYAVGAI